MSTPRDRRAGVHPRRLTTTLGAAGLVLAGLIAPASVTVAQAGPGIQPRNGATPTTTYAVIRLIGVGDNPVGVAIDGSDDTVYVTNTANPPTVGTVSVINGRTGAVVGAAIGVGLTPIGIAVNQRDDTVYVPAYDDPILWLVNGRSGALQSFILVQRFSFGVAVDQIDDTVYVTNRLGAHVLVINGRSQAVSNMTPVGQKPEGVAVNQDDDSVYVTNFDDSTVSVINGRTAAVSSTIAVGGKPRAVAVNQIDDSVYVTNFDDSTVSVINGRTSSGASSIPVGRNPYGVAVDQNDATVYVTNSGSDNVSIINGQNATVAGTISVGDDPRGVAVDDAGANQGLVYIANNQDSSVSVIGRVTPSLGSASGNAGDPVTINVDVPQVAYDVDDSTVASVSFGGTSLTPTPLAGDAWRVIAPAGAAGSSVAVTVTFRGGLTASAGTFTYATTPPPPVFPPSAPVSVTAAAGDTRATLTWAAPSDSGSFPVTTYEVRSTPASKSCLATTLTCTITGLTNGTAYTFEARALNGAGWGPWSVPSNAVTPIAPVPPSITITGSRGTGADRQTITVSGVSTGLTSTQVRAHVKLRGQADYQPGRLVDLSPDGSFSWQRTTSKKAYVYFTGDGVQSKIVIIPAAR